MSACAGDMGNLPGVSQIPAAADLGSADGPGRGRKAGQHLRLKLRVPHALHLKQRLRTWCKQLPSETKACLLHIPAVTDPTAWRASHKPTCLVCLGVIRGSARAKHGCRVLAEKMRQRVRLPACLTAAHITLKPCLIQRQRDLPCEAREVYEEDLPASQWPAPRPAQGLPGSGPEGTPPMPPSSLGAPTPVSAFHWSSAYTLPAKASQEV